MKYIIIVILTKDILLEGSKCGKKLMGSIDKSFDKKKNKNKNLKENKDKKDNTSKKHILFK